MKRFITHQPKPIVGVAVPYKEEKFTYRLNPPIDGYDLVLIGTHEAILKKTEPGPVDVDWPRPSNQLPQLLCMRLNEEPSDQEKRALLHMGYVPFF